MKSVLASFKPKYCELIASGKKTVELRKTRPKLQVPFKCYVYCTLANSAKKPNNNLWLTDKTGFNWFGNGKVVGEFVCDSVEDFSKFPYDLDALYRHIKLNACITDYNVIAQYLKHRKCGYGWHISDLVIYDKPKELSEFYKPCSHDCKNCKYWYSGLPIGYGALCMWEDSVITRPPQSWCYVEGVQV